VKLNPQQLDAHVRKGLAPVYLVSGDEPLLVDEVLDRLRVAAIDQGYTERESYVAERGFDWNELEAGLQNMSLFSERRLIEARLPTGKPGTEGSKFFVTAAAHPTPDTIIVVIMPKASGSTAKSKWVTSLAKAGVWIPLFAPGEADLPAWITGRLKAAGLRADKEALQLLVAQMKETCWLQNRR